jgi:two-component system, chemotaxis family, chemotaxis protein CheY
MIQNSKKILIIDDNVALARVIQFAVEGAGFETATAQNARLAFELAKQTQFDVVITDQQMPEMTGVDLCRCLRDMPEYQECPIILLTAKGLELELPRLQHELDIDATFSKPFSPSALVKTVHELLATAVS